VPTANFTTDGGPDTVIAPDVGSSAPSPMLLRQATWTLQKRRGGMHTYRHHHSPPGATALRCACGGACRARRLRLMLQVGVGMPGAGATGKNMPSRVPCRKLAPNPTTKKTCLAHRKEFRPVPSRCRCNSAATNLVDCRKKRKANDVHMHGGREQMLSNAIG
jgi:hypothetical protein